MLTLSAIPACDPRPRRSDPWVSAVPDAIEGFNAALRPFLYVHKGVTQGFLELFRAYFNLRTRRWGRHKGTSAQQCLTGERVDDWLTVLGYPLSPTLS